MYAAIVDTNILVRAFLSGKKSEDNILKAVLNRGCAWISGSDQLKEFIEVLGYTRITSKFKFNEEEVNLFCQWIVDETREVEPEAVNLCRDPDDNYILGLAIRASKRQEVYLITGDKDILELKKKLKNIKILEPGVFLKLC